MNDSGPYLIYDWKLKIYLRIVGKSKLGYTIVDPRTEKNRTIRFGQVGDDKRYRICD